MPSKAGRLRMVAIGDRSGVAMLRRRHGTAATRINESGGGLAGDLRRSGQTAKPNLTGRDPKDSPLTGRISQAIPTARARVGKDWSVRCTRAYRTRATQA